MENKYYISNIGQYEIRPRHITKNSGRKHKNFVDERPLSISEMMRRATLGIPLSAYRPKDDNIPLNNRFYNDDFDVLDMSIKNDMRLSEEAKKAQLEQNAKLKAQRDEFEAWKLEKAKADKQASEFKPD